MIFGLLNTTQVVLSRRFRKGGQVSPQKRPPSEMMFRLKLTEFREDRLENVFERKRWKQGLIVSDCYRTDQAERQRVCLWWWGAESLQGSAWLEKRNRDNTQATSRWLWLMKEDPWGSNARDLSPGLITFHWVTWVRLSDVWKTWNIHWSQEVSSQQW